MSRVTRREQTCRWVANPWGTDDGQDGGRDKTRQHRDRSIVVGARGCAGTMPLVGPVGEEWASPAGGLHLIS